MGKRDSERILDELGAVMRQLARVTGGPDDSLLLTGTQRLSLFEIGIGGPLRLVDLADKLGVTAPTASRAVDALVANGLVERHPDPEDRRAQRIALTETGRGHFEERKRRAWAAFDPAVRTLSPADRAQLSELLARLRDALSEQSAS